MFWVVISTHLLLPFSLHFFLYLYGEFVKEPTRVLIKASFLTIVMINERKCSIGRLKIRVERAHFEISR